LKKKSDPNFGTTPSNQAIASNSEHPEIKESIAYERALNAVCKKFVNNRADDGTTLSNWCSSHSCCQEPNACANWSSVATYEVCENSCNGVAVCNNVASSATSNGASIKFDLGSCDGNSSCLSLARYAPNLQTLIVGNNACTENTACYYAATNASSLKQLIIADDQCKSSNGCNQCGADSTFDDTLQLTEQCCAQAGRVATECQPSSVLSSIPSNQPSISSSPSNLPSSIPSNQPSYQPSSIPSNQPSNLPSSIPSNQPSNLPSSIPSNL